MRKKFANVCKLLSAVALAAGSLYGQSIIQNTPVKTIQPFDRSKPMESITCSSPQATAGTHMVDFNDTNGTPNGYVDCHGNFHGGGISGITGTGTPNTLMGWVTSSSAETVPGSIFDASGNLMMKATGPSSWIDADCNDSGSNFCFKFAAGGFIATNTGETAALAINVGGFTAITPGVAFITTGGQIAITAAASDLGISAAADRKSVV